MKQNSRIFLILFLLLSNPLYAGTAPDFTFTDLAGNKYTSASLKGTPLVVNIGSHW